MFVYKAFRDDYNHHTELQGMILMVQPVTSAVPEFKFHKAWRHTEDVSNTMVKSLCEL